MRLVARSWQWALRLRVGILCGHRERLGSHYWLLAWSWCRLRSSCWWACRHPCLRHRWWSWWLAEVAFYLIFGITQFLGKALV